MHRQETMALTCNSRTFRRRASVGLAVGILLGAQPMMAAAAWLAKLAAPTTGRWTSYCKDFREVQTQGTGQKQWAQLRRWSACPVSSKAGRNAPAKHGSSNNAQMLRWVHSLHRLTRAAVSSYRVIPCSPADSSLYHLSPQCRLVTPPEVTTTSASEMACNKAALGPSAMSAT